MPRENHFSHAIALLATGDEIINGDILNSNAQEIAQQLFNHSCQVQTHLVVPDDINQIERAILFLLQNHSAVIITGGLGPTSDDLTRYALAKALDLQLIFDQPTWDGIVQRLQRFGYKIPPANNRQQALFPENATIIPNPNGTAAGCVLHSNEKFIFMLPGPPSECMPMIERVVIPTLVKAGFQKSLYHDKWLLFSVSEGKIAEEMDQLLKPFECVTGYRLCYPYLEFKIASTQQENFTAAIPVIEKNIAPYMIGNGKKTASVLLKNKLPELKTVLTIRDFATGGLLEATIKTPATYSYLDFGNENPQIEIQGLEEYWHSKTTELNQSHLKITFTDKEKKDVLETKIPFRDDRVKLYAVEFICWKILEFFQL